MTKDEILEFINKNPVFFLATQDGNQPRVRGMMVVEANENGILFTTGKPKDLYNQLSNNQLVELCFYNASANKQVRISGKAELTEELEVKKKVVEKFPFLKPLVEKEGYDILAPYYLREGKALVWTMETNLAPKEYIEL
ncbi:MAG: pyridoxamine 5'-phosphate oxidase family protein [bacterium]